jgi:hypothetical protein
MWFKYQYVIEEREHYFKEINVLNSTEKIHYHAGSTQEADNDSGVNLDAIFLFKFRTSSSVWILRAHSCKFRRIFALLIVNIAASDLNIWQKIVRFTYSLCRNQRHDLSRRLLSLFCSRCKSLTISSRAVYAILREACFIRGPHYILFIVSSVANKCWVIGICIWYSLVACLAFPSQKPYTKCISAYSVLANRSI